jgi:hypothetical protein
MRFPAWGRSIQRGFVLGAYSAPNGYPGMEQPASGSQLSQTVLSGRAGSPPGRRPNSLARRAGAALYG